MKRSAGSKIKRFFAIFVLLIGAVACNPASKFAVTEVDELYLNGLTSVHTQAVVENRSAKKLTVESATLRFFYKKRELATAHLILPQTISANSTERIRIDLRLEAESLADLQTLQRRAEMNSPQLSVNVKAYLRYGNSRRKVELKDIPYSSIIANFESVIR